MDAVCADTEPDGQPDTNTHTYCMHCTVHTDTGIYTDISNIDGTFMKHFYDSGTTDQEYSFSG